MGFRGYSRFDDLTDNQRDVYAKFIAAQTPMSKEEFSQLRQELRLSHRKLAKLLGLQARTTEGYANGDRKVPLQVGMVMRLFNEVHFTTPVSQSDGGGK